MYTLIEEEFNAAPNTSNSTPVGGMGENYILRDFNTNRENILYEEVIYYSTS